MAASNIKEPEDDRCEDHDRGCCRTIADDQIGKVEFGSIRAGGFATKEDGEAGEQTAERAKWCCVERLVDLPRSWDDVYVI
jgi:hypothetical protein